MAATGHPDGGLKGREMDDVGAGCTYKLLTVRVGRIFETYGKVVLRLNTRRFIEPWRVPMSRTGCQQQISGNDVLQLVLRRALLSEQGGSKQGSASSENEKYGNIRRNV